MCRRDPDAFAPGSQKPPYILTQPIAADAQLSKLLFDQCIAAVGGDAAQQGLNATADSFYSSQVRLKPQPGHCLHQLQLDQHLWHMLPISNKS